MRDVISATATDIARACEVAAAFKQPDLLRFLSSDLILDAELALEGRTIGPDGLLTYVWDRKVKSVNPGYCFKRAGYTVKGRSADGRKTLLQKPLPNTIQSEARIAGVLEQLRLIA